MADGIQESANFFRLIKVIVDNGSEVLRDVILQKVQPDTLDNVILTNMTKINWLHKRRILFDEQYSLLTEAPPDPEKFDISLLTIILRNICPNVPAPMRGWDSRVPDPTDVSLGADILRLQNVRNTISAHSPNTRVTDVDFENIWSDVSAVIVRISNHGSLRNIRGRIDAVKTENLDPSSSVMQTLLKVFCEWQKHDEKYQAIMEELKKQGATQDAMFALQVDTHSLQMETLSLVKDVVGNSKCSATQQGIDQSDGASSATSDSSMLQNTATSDVDKLQESFSSMGTSDSKDDHLHLTEHFDACIVYTEGNRDRAAEIVSVIEGLDGNFKAVCYDDEEYFGFFTPASQPGVISEHCVLFLVVIADNLQQDKHAKYVSSTVSMAKANTAQIRPVLFSKSDEKCIPKSLSNTRPIRWYDEDYIKMNLHQLLKQCRDIRKPKEEKQFKTRKDIDH